MPLEINTLGNEPMLTAGPAPVPVIGSSAGGTAVQGRVVFIASLEMGSLALNLRQWVRHMAALTPRGPH